MVCKQTMRGERMSGKGNCYPSRDLRRKPCWAVDNTAMETSFKTITLGTLLRNALSCSAKLNLSGETHGKAAGRLRWPSLSTSMGFTIRDAATQHWAGKARSLLNEGWLKRALGAALNRDRSISNSCFKCSSSCSFQPVLLKRSTYPSSTFTK